MASSVHSMVGSMGGSYRNAQCSTQAAPAEGACRADAGPDLAGPATLRQATRRAASWPDQGVRLRRLGGLVTDDTLRSDRPRREELSTSASNATGKRRVI